MASKFSLAGVKDDPEWKIKAVKDYFRTFTIDKDFVMVVRPPETSSFTQYCDLYHLNRNVKDVLKSEMEKILPFNYIELPLPSM